MSVRPATSTTFEPRSDPGRSSGLEHAAVCVLVGGRSSEREVSLSSGATIRSALAEPTDPTDARGPRRVFTLEVLADGRWQVGRRALEPAAALAALSDVDVFFSALHGGEGEDGTLQGLLECAGKAYTGTGVAGSAVAMDKVFARELLAARGLRVAPALTIERAHWEAQPAAVRAELEAWRVPGWVVKPRSGGSSLGCSIVRAPVTDPAAWKAALGAALVWEDEALVETLVEGIELTGAVLQTPDAGLEALPVVEIRPKAGRFFDYEEKYTAGGAIELCPPRGVPAAVAELVRAASLVAHRTLRCRGLSRSDFIAPRDGGEPVFLELNTLPGMTPRSLVPQAARVAGIDYRTLCLWIAAEALGRAPRAFS